MNNSEYLSEEKTIETYTYYDLSQLTSCLLDETNELQQDFKRKSSFFCDQHELISNNETKLRLLNYYTHLLKTTMNEVEQQIANIDSELNELEALHVKPMSYICQKSECNCDFCRNQECEAYRFLTNLENLNSNMYSINELAECVDSETKSYSVALDPKNHPYRIIGQILQAHCDNLNYIEKTLSEIMKKIAIVNELYQNINSV